MDHAQDRRAQRGVAGAEVGGEVEAGGGAAADLGRRGAVVGDVEGNVGGAGDIEEGGVVHLLVGAVRWFGVDQNCFDHVGAVDVVGSRCADGVIRACLRVRTAYFW